MTACRRRAAAWMAILCLGAAPVGAMAPSPAGQGVDLAGMDAAVAPGDDFFAYAMAAG